MVKLRVGSDVDGILTSFEAHYCPLVTRETGIKFPQLGKEGWPDCWDYDLAAGMSKGQRDRMWKIIKNSSDFWRNLPPRPDAKEFLSNLSTIPKDDVWFVTNRVGLNAGQQTVEWLAEHGFANANVLVTGDKGWACRQLGLDLYIDDKIENCEDVRDNALDTNGFMLARPWNRPIHWVSRLPKLMDYWEIIKLELEG